MPMKFFFVYGTLKVGGVFAERFNTYRLSSEKATLHDMSLYNLGWFPGILPGTGSVIGEVHEYKDPDIVLRHMDRIEGYSGNKNDLFTRECRTVITEAGKEIEAVVYIYNSNINPKIMKIVENGVWDLNKEGEK